MNSTTRTCALAFLVILSVASLEVAQVRGGENEQGWINLIGEAGLAAWRKPTGDWYAAGEVLTDSKNARMLSGKPGKGILVNGRTGRTENLLSKSDFGDIEAHIEFLIPKGSNSGVKFQGLYEIQIMDSWGVKKPSASDCGGIYPRAELEPNYRHIDKGIPPRLNASRRPGEWQVLEATFLAPRFDTTGRKTASARFVKVLLNGRLIHDNVELRTPTGHAWREKEVVAGPLLLQADHGPVAFRNIRIRPK